ncbi:MAG: hypothetical protein ACI4CY_04295 [Candidatus Gastranaerophilaceae bacterium]
MAVRTLKKTVECVTKSDNDFEKYLIMQRKNTTYNGISLDCAQWYKEIFGIQVFK